MGGQFHLDAETYLAMMRSEIDRYDELQAALADATKDVSAESILDLGSGTGETAMATLRRHLGATLVGIDSSEDMLSIARHRLPSATFIVAGLEDPLPEGPFDVVVSAFAIHHLDAEQKALLFRRVSEVLTAGGRFAMLDVVIPEEPVAAPIPLEEGVDKPSSVEDMLNWLDAAGLRAETVYSAGDLAILAATAPEL
jgi:ubiquinone/menaquinone biosynthesis C-methylase UbiE